MPTTIKFRALSQDNKWHYGGQDTESLRDFFAGFNSDNCDLKKETLGQFTGLIDKNGKEIYEGHIVNLGDNYPCEVKYDNENCQFLFYEGGFANPLAIHEATSYTSPWEVIGNIYENPELLN